MWPTRVEKLDHPDLDFIFAAHKAFSNLNAARETFSNLNVALHALSLGPHCAMPLCGRQGFALRGPTDEFSNLSI